jgi:hypothetical protein
LLEGLEPSIAIGNFQAQNSANGQPEGGVSTLTDAQYGAVGEGDTLTGASAGTTAGGTLYYTLPPSSNGWDITSIESYGGWSDIGRNNQGYDFYYATAADPYTFIELDSINPAYSPPVTVAEPNATRVIWTSGLGAPLAINVVAVEFVFDVSVFNGWEGYNELQVFGTNAVAPVAPVQQAPVLVTDIAPGYGSEVVGSQVTFNANFYGAVSYQWQFNNANIKGATNEALTLTDLTTNMAGGYDLVASNSYGTTSTSTAQFTVNPAPVAANGIIISQANQLNVDNGNGLNSSEFTPTWTVASGSLIAHQLPSTVGPGNFKLQVPSLGLPVLTDGTIGLCAGDATADDLTNFACCGSGGGAGQYVIYTLAGSASGYNLDSIVTYGGWDDSGRNEQNYTVSYSTVGAPTTFTQLGAVSDSGATTLGPAAANVSRLTWAAANGGPLASNVAAVEFDFALPSAQLNGWEGYAELQLFGTPSPSKGPTISSSTVSGGNLILAGSGGTPGAAYAWLTSTNLTTPLSEWTQDGTGKFDSSGNFSSSIPIKTTEPARFFRLSTP